MAKVWDYLKRAAVYYLLMLYYSVGPLTSSPIDALTGQDSPRSPSTGKCYITPVRTPTTAPIRLKPRLLQSRLPSHEISRHGA